jgi:hypothetical protein
LQGLKFLRTLWLASVAGGPYQYTARELRDAHFDLKIPPDVFDETDAELGRSLDHFNVPEREKGEVPVVARGFTGDVEPVRIVARQQCPRSTRVPISG